MVNYICMDDVYKLLYKRPIFNSRGNLFINTLYF
jgi:hypothetical protein